ncbi:MAG TPA: hypothetical protein VF274_07315 [Alphaproteobacteria bacterium]|jgi:hypothetical protein
MAQLSSNTAFRDFVSPFATDGTVADVPSIMREAAAGPAAVPSR